MEVFIFFLIALVIVVLWWSITKDCNQPKLQKVEWPRKKEYSQEYLLAQMVYDKLNIASKEYSCEQILACLEWECNEKNVWPEWYDKLWSLLNRRHRSDAFRFIRKIWIDLWTKENQDSLGELYCEDDIL